MKKRLVKRALNKGEEHEMEHTDNPNVAKKIAADHLKEMPDYYERLEKMEHEKENMPMDKEDMPKGEEYEEISDTPLEDIVHEEIEKRRSEHHDKMVEEAEDVKRGAEKMFKRRHHEW